MEWIALLIVHGLLAVALLGAITHQALGAVIYTHYTISSRIAIIQLQLWKPYGLFEIKEHFAALGLAVLPAYWYFWRVPNAPGATSARGMLTAVLTFIVWWNFLIGHIINNLRGFA